MKSQQIPLLFSGRGRASTQVEVRAKRFSAPLFWLYGYEHILLCEKDLERNIVQNLTGFLGSGIPTGNRHDGIKHAVAYLGMTGGGYGTYRS